MGSNESTIDQKEQLVESIQELRQQICGDKQLINELDSRIEMNYTKMNHLYQELQQLILKNNQVLLNDDKIVKQHWTQLNLQKAEWDRRMDLFSEKLELMQKRFQQIDTNDN
ncbi:hypothetical protein BLOT_016604 [Blomia tropicalis]|nr:hypothetical protein BLOT_016604 [Blomia tropicalis]